MSDKIFFLKESFVFELYPRSIPISWTMSGEATVPEVLRQYTPVKGQVDRDHQETDHMGRALLERLAMPIILTEG